MNTLGIAGLRVRAVAVAAATAALLLPAACGEVPPVPPEKWRENDSTGVIDSTLHGLPQEDLPMASLTVHMTLNEDDPIFDDYYSGQGSGICLGLWQNRLLVYTNMHCTGLTELLHDGDLKLFGDGELDLSTFYMEVEFPSGDVVRVDSFALYHPYDMAVLLVNARYIEEGRDYVILPMLQEGIYPPPGTPVITGSPLGLQGSVTAGIVSAYRLFDDSHDGYGSGPYIQFDAAISPGSSGGPLLVGDGEGYFLIGMNSSYLETRYSSPGLGSQNINFALDLRDVFASMPALPKFYPADLDGAIEAMDEVFDVDAVEAGR